MLEIVTRVNDWVWSPAIIYLLLGTGVFFSVLTRFVQVRMFREMIRLLFSSEESDKGVSSFQSLALSLSGRVGTGNIAGVAAAIGFGGPGAVFWMWLVAFLGASTAYVESALGQIYKEESDNQYRGGPAFYIEKAMGQKWYAWIFAVATIVATGIFLPGVQANSISSSVGLVFGTGATFDTAIGAMNMTSILCGAGIVVFLGAIIFGGVKRIAHVTEVVVPFMAIIYIAVAVIIILINITELPRMIWIILDDAFTPMAGFGAVIGWGVKRGVFSNEAGQGTGAHAAAASEVEHPAQQGLVQAFSVYVDTLFVCSATAFMILIMESYNVHGSEGAFIVQNLPATVDANSPAFTQLAVDGFVSGVGKPFIAVALFFFAFTTMLAYYYIAETNVAYIRRVFKFPGDMLLLKLAIMGSSFYGAVKAAKVAWGLGDIGVGIMAWLNVVGILILFFAGNAALKALKDYEAQRKAGVEKYTFDPQALGIKGAKFWEERIRKGE